jgi:hypothetical protein
MEATLFSQLSLQLVAVAVVVETLTKMVALVVQVAVVESSLAFMALAVLELRVKVLQAQTIKVELIQAQHTVLVAVVALVLLAA